MMNTDRYKARYPRPQDMRRADGSARYAHVAFLMLNDNYLPGTLTAGYGLRLQRTQADLVCLVTPEISSAARRALALVYDHVLEVEKIYVPHARRQERQDRPYYFTRLNSLRLGADGDLGLHYDKIVVLDSDVLPLHSFDHLFTLEAPAGIINENKAHFVETDAQGAYVRPADLEQSGQWNWHRIYAACPHGEPIPREITDRVRHDPKNMGINGSLFVFTPSLAELDEIRADLERPEVQRLVGDLFDWPDMQYLTMRWSGAWRNIDLRFSGFNGYPGIEHLCGSHFAGFKPWYFNREKAMARYVRHADFRLFFDTYSGMAQRYPALLEMPKLKRILGQIRRLDTGNDNRKKKRKK